MSIDPPNSEPPPKWAQTLVNAANGRNRARGSSEIYVTADLIAAWKACGGCCAFSGLPFGFQVIGNGQAKRPFAPSPAPLEHDLRASIAHPAARTRHERPIIDDRADANYVAPGVPFWRCVSFCIAFWKRSLA